MADTSIDALACFMRGTRLATPDGNRLIEDLAVGDLISVVAGEPARVKWIGRRLFKKSGIPRPSEAMPIRICKDAIASGVPCADLVVSPAHCLFLDGVLIPAQFLVNGCTIAQDLGFEEFEYFHIELEQHAIIVAENTPTESYLDIGNRAFFANPDVVDLFPDHLPKSSEDACVPCIAEGPALLAAKLRLLARAEELGFETVRDPALRLRVDGRELKPLSVEGAVYTFSLPRSFHDVWLMSRSSIAADVLAREADDRRRLGVAVSRIVLNDGTYKREIPIDHPMLALGFHDCEREGGRLWRWSNGEAHLPMSLIGLEKRQPVMIEIHLQGTLPGYRVDAVIDFAKAASRRAAA